MIDEQNLFNDDWDYLIILDACRYDTFEKFNFIPGKLTKVKSQGSHTAQWLHETFKGKTLDWIYYSCNPIVGEWYMKNKLNMENPFKELHPVWDWGWSNNLNTVHPITIAQLMCLKKSEQNEKKKHVFHFIQPHCPFIENGISLIKGTRGWDNQRELSLKGECEKSYNVWDMLKRGEVTAEEMVDAYERCLKDALSIILRMLKYLKDETRVVITSDHGNCFGEHGIIKHPINRTDIPELADVPWLVVDK